ncbi:MAG: DUF1819 family protein, partial [Erysipelotrichia bacterium]|nr:DUF1819 family protein [Erysipelotrichia bacterium]
MKVVLVCYAGMSTSIMVNKMKQYGSGKGIEMDVKAIPLSELKDNLSDVDAVALGPQVGFAEADVDKLLNGQIPHMVIDTKEYGRMRGDLVVEENIMQKQSVSSRKRVFAEIKRRIESLTSQQLEYVNEANSSDIRNLIFLSILKT